MRIIWLPTCMHIILTPDSPKGIQDCTKLPCYHSPSRKIAWSDVNIRHSALVDNETSLTENSCFGHIFIWAVTTPSNRLNDILVEIILINIQFYYFCYLFNYSLPNNHFLLHFLPLLIFILKNDTEWFHPIYLIAK